VNPDRPIRAAFVSHYTHLRMGGQRSMALLIEHLDRRIVEPLAICPGPGELTDHLAALGCPVVHIPLYPIKLRTLPRVWESASRFRALVRQRAIDILAPDAPRDALTCGLATLGTPAKLIWFVRLTGPDALDPLLERLADGFIGDSDATRARFSRSARVTARYRTIVGGADLQRFSPPADRAALRRDLGIPQDRFVLLFVGQVTRPKGVMDIVEAVALLRAAPERPAPLLLLVGTPHPPEIAGEIGVQDGIRLLGQREDVHRWMQAADVLVSASHQDTEGMSRVLYEAMACGAVPIATDIRGNRDALTPETGVLVPERSPERLARAVTSLRADPGRLAALRANGVRRARETFDIKFHARGVEQFYTELVPLRTRVDERA
jgi:glycosyltransferase involved in cell wall biosynthesis